jgi:hypothetical protein
MKTQTQNYVPILLASLIIFGGVGCKSNYVRSDATAWRLDRTATEVRSTAGYLDATSAALNDMLTNPSGDLRIQYDRYCQSLAQFIAATDRASSEVKTLQRHSKAYFENWDKELAQMNDEQIRQTSATRKAEAMRDYDTAMRSYQSGQDALEPVIAYFEDIRKALSTDLTRSGLASAQAAAMNANQKAVNAKAQITQSAAELSGLAGKMSSYVITGPKPPPAPVASEQHSS